VAHILVVIAMEPDVGNRLILKIHVFFFLQQSVVRVNLLVQFFTFEHENTNGRILDLIGLSKNHMAVLIF